MDTKLDGIDLLIERLCSSEKLTLPVYLGQVVQTFPKKPEAKPDTPPRRRRRMKESWLA